MSLSIPEFMPVLSYGAHRAGGQDGACLMELASFLAGERWSDRPRCTNQHLARAARLSNDLIPDEDRHKLLDLLPRLMGTTEPGADQAIFDAAARYVEPLVSHKDQWVRDDAKYTQHEAGLGTWYTTVNAAHAIVGAEGDFVGYLTALIDAYDEATGRTAPATVTEDDLRRCAELTGAKA